MFLDKLVSSYAKKENDAIRKSIEFQKSSLPEDVVIERNISFDGGRMNVYHPAEEGIYPVVINIHGGGMVCGLLEQNDLFCSKLSHLGFVVFGIEYPLIPEADVPGMYRVLARGINRVGEIASNYCGNPEIVFWTGDSAGAYLITNLAGLKAYSKMRDAFNVPEITTSITALGLISGMFYTNKKDQIGLVLPNLMFGKGFKKSAFFPYTDMERPEFMSSLPSVYMVSSEDDMLKHHTLSYSKALIASGHRVKLKMFPKDKRLVHAFVALYPDYEESGTAIAEMVEFFRDLI